jgi:superfamily II DNA/RNA helicase
LYFFRGLTMTFAQMNLNADVVKAITTCGYTTPTPIQASSIPEILKGKDLVASAQTGTGKTAAFVLPILHHLAANPIKKAYTKNPSPEFLILTPTRELATQITDAAEKYGRFLDFNIVSVVGGMPIRQQLRNLSRPTDIVVATPGRLLDLMENHKLDLSAVKMLVLDEADRMLDMGFIDDVKFIAKSTPKERQTLLFSATVDKKLSSVIRDLLKNPISIDLSDALMAPKLIKQEAYIADNNQHKERLLQHFLDNENIYKAIIFSGTKINADYLARRLRDQDYSAAALHGDLKQNVRNKTVEQLRRGAIQFLVATDVAARGIDINDVTHVINYDLPKFSEDYVHRIGRTGRAGKTGVAISLVLPVDARHLQKIEKFIGEKITFNTIPGLEPTKRMHNSSANPDAGRKKKFGGKSGGGYKSKSYDDRGGFSRSSGGGSSERSGYAKRTEGRSFAKSSEPRHSEGRSFAKSSEPRHSEGRSFARSSEPRHSEGRSFARSSEPRQSEGRSFARSSEPRNSEGRSSFSRGGEARSEGRSFARSSEPRQSEGRSFARSSEPRNTENRGSFGKNSAPRPSESRSFERGSADRSSFVRKDFKPSEGRSSFARGDSAEGRPSLARNETKSGDGKNSYARRSEARSEGRGETRGGENRGSFAGRSSGRGRSGEVKTGGRGENRTSFSKPSGNDSRITFVRDRDSDKPSSRGDFRDKPTTRPTTYAKTSFGKQGEGKARRARED